MDFGRIKSILYAVIAVAVVGMFMKDCFCSSSDEETVEIPTEGTITTVKEVTTDDWKIEDETPVAVPEDSRIIAQYMDGKVDTFTLEQARLVQADSTGSTSTRPISRIMSAASFGLMGYMLGRSMATPPMASAYSNPGAHARSTASATRMRSTATTVTRPRSGFGGGRSTRSIGG
jgi:hypothetical protein